jgi:hypothetical protein
MPIYFLLSKRVLLSVGREPTPQAYFERGALFYNALTTGGLRQLLLLQAFGDVLGKIIGDAQILAEKMNLSLDAVCEKHLPIAARHPSADTHIGGAQDSGDLALHLAARLELLYCGVQRNQVGYADSRPIAAPKDLSKMSGFAHSHDEILVDRGTKLGWESQYSRRQLARFELRTRRVWNRSRLGLWSRGFSLLQLLAGWRSNVGTRVDQLNALSSPCPFVNARIA